ncbi:MAG: GNAT family N-acetyltransferase [Actinobacteria bacterium]|nr:GNAT family N-acetyltransferase [Actinomycetota bacterium]
MGKDVDRLELRTVTEDEFRAWHRSVGMNFGSEPTPAATARRRPVFELDRCFAVFDGERIVANSGVFSFDVSLPGGSRRPCAGVTTVGVASDWRRRGLLGRMMRTMLDQARERQEPFAALYASEATIYGRYGFGIAAPHVEVVADTVRARIERPIGTDDVALLDVPGALASFPPVFDAARHQRGGMMSLDAWWKPWLENDEPDERDGYSPRFLASVPGRGFAIYRWKEHFDHMTPSGDVEVTMLVATDPEAESALWEFVFSIDLTVKVRSFMRPPDDALLHLVDNRAVVRDTGSEHLYLRLVDLPEALTARAYAADGEVAFTVTDASCPWNAGTWRLQVVDGTATCEKVDGHGDVALDVAELASITLGGVRLDHLVRGRRAEARRPEVVPTVDHMFATERAPWNPFEF